MNGNTSSPISEEKSTPREEKLPGKKSELYEIIRFTIIAFLIVIPIRMYIAQPFIVSGDSMVPTFHNGEYLIIDEVSYAFNEPKRGDVIVFRFPNDTSRFFIKRIIALPGETININGSAVNITTKGGGKLELDENYVQADFFSQLDKTLGEDEYFVMGDNRQASSDSRAWGVLNRQYIVGRAFVRVFPLSELELYPGKIDYGIIDKEGI